MDAVEPDADRPGEAELPRLRRALDEGVPAGTVAREIRRGWRLGEELVRPTQVVVATAAPPARPA
jgi:hypothetical protein